MQQSLSSGNQTASVQPAKFIKDINELYGEYQAGADLEPRTPLTNYEFDDAEPGIVAERG